MAFPPVIVETAFAGEEDETLFATGGWSDITQWVQSVSGDLRGRTYETNKTESGSVSIMLDNLDGRFTPNALSPYWPNIEPNKRLRIRGKNMVAPNIALGGGKDHSNQLFVFADFEAATNPGATTGFTDPVYVAGNPVGVPAGLDGHVEVTISAGVTSAKRIIAWLSPIEVATRLTHSSYFWRVSGTEPASTASIMELYYFDTDGNSIIADLRPQVFINGTSTTPSRYSLSHAPYGSVKYALVIMTIWFQASGPTNDITYALTGVQTELPANLAPQVSAQWDVVHWQALEGSETITRDSGSGSAQMAWNGSTALYQRIPHLIPGETYSVAAEVFKTGTGPDIQMSMDDGLTGPILTTENVWTTMRTTFEANGVTQDLKFIPQTAATLGDILRVRGLRVEIGNNASLPVATGLEVEPTTWERPLDVFEGWVEEWPWTPQGATSTITVGDRMSRVGAIDLANTLPEALDYDNPDLVIPFNDTPAATAVTWYGNWADDSKVALIPFRTTKGSVAGTGYDLGIEGPTDEPAIDWNPNGTWTAGYFLEVPYNKIIVAPPTGGGTSPTPPPPPKTTYTYTWGATWSRTFDGSGATRFDDSPLLYQGDFDGSHGNQRALVGFNWADLRARLKGAEILEVIVTFHNVHWRWNAGEFLRIGTHGYLSKPGTWNGAFVKPGRVQAWWNEGQTRSIGLPVAIGYELRDGSANGIATGPGRGGGTPQDDYGYFAGATQGGAPTLKITYRK